MSEKLKTLAKQFEKTTEQLDTEIQRVESRLRDLKRMRATLEEHYTFGDTVEIEVCTFLTNPENVTGSARGTSLNDCLKRTARRDLSEQALIFINTGNLSLSVHPKDVDPENERGFVQLNEDRGCDTRVCWEKKSRNKGWVG